MHCSSSQDRKDRLLMISTCCSNVSVLLLELADMMQTLVAFLHLRHGQAVLLLLLYFVRLSVIEMWFKKGCHKKQWFRSHEVLRLDLPRVVPLLPLLLPSANPCLLTQKDRARMPFGAARLLFAVACASPAPHACAFCSPAPRKCPARLL